MDGSGSGPYSGIEIVEGMVYIAAYNFSQCNSIRMRSYTSVLTGTWSYANGSSGSLSDIRHKNSIENLNDNYENLFNNIQPIKYKYNNGTSNRYHIGFIAQQIEESILNSNLTEKDAALVIDIQDTDKNGKELETKTKYLRYEEFIALNTWQIQKLKARVTDLENKITELTKEK